MNPAQALDGLLARIGAARPGRTVYIGDAQRATWPPEAAAAFEAAGLLRSAAPTYRIICPGCEERCPMRAEQVPGPPDRFFIVCDKPQNNGRIRLSPEGLRQWMTGVDLLAAALARCMRVRAAAGASTAAGTWALGYIEDHEDLGPATLRLESRTFHVRLGSRELPLSGLLAIAGGRVGVKAHAMQRLLGEEVETPQAGVGSPAARTRQAKAAADARHGKPGGSRARHAQIREIWASGKYDSRDRCAEEECAALGISYSTARKALRNTPEPRRP